MSEIKKSKRIKHPDSISQQIVSLWQGIHSMEDRSLVIEQLKGLYESSLDEKQLNVERGILEDGFTSEPGDITDKTNHTIIAGNICHASVTKRITPVDLIFTSPPYNADIKYDSHVDNLPLHDYLSFLDDSINACDPLLKDGGRFVINIRDIIISKGSRYPIILALHDKLCKKFKYIYRGLHIWYKGREESSFAWGSWRSSKNPSIIDLYEYVFVFQKGDYPDGKDNLEKTEFIENVIGVWKIRPIKKIIGQKKKNILNHPCPFPSELARRVIKLYSHVGDTVLDPFAGIASTAIAAAQTGRNSVSVEISKKYCKSGYGRFKYSLSDIDSRCSIELKE